MTNKSLFAWVVVLLLISIISGAKPSQARSVSPGNSYGTEEPRLIVSAPVAAKPDGNRQPLDLYVDITDQKGKPVEGAKVLARATDFNTYVDAPLVDVGKGRYMVCNFGSFNGKGPGAVRIHVQAEKSGYTPGESDGEDTVGRLCSLF